MPPEVIDAMRAYRAALETLDGGQASRLMRLWLDVTRGLDVELEAVAAEMGRRAARGLPVSVWHLRRMERYQSLMAQVTEQVARFGPAAMADVTEMQMAFARLGIEHAQAMIDMQMPGIIGQFDRLPLDAFLNMAGNTGAGTPLGSLLGTLPGESAQAATRALMRGTALGWHPSRTAQAMRQGASLAYERALLIARTEQLRVYREATREQYAASGVVEGYRRVASRSGRTCIACLLADGRFYTLDVPFAQHPNCVVEGTRVLAPKILGVSKRRYDGFVFDIITVGGNHLTVTPNHPILTDKGWVAANFLKEGDNVVSSSDSEGAALFVAPNDQQSPTVIEDVVAAFLESGNVISVRVPVSAKHFHGDGMGSDIAIIGSDSLLQSDRQPLIAEQLGKATFFGSGMGSLDFFAASDIASMFKCLGSSDAGLLGDSDTPVMLFGGRLRGKQPVGFRVVSDVDSRFFEAASDDSAGNTVLTGKRVFGFPTEILSYKVIDGEFDSIAGAFDVGLPEVAVERGPSDIPFLQHFGDGHSERVVLDRIACLGRRFFSGHVYNLQTETGWYSAEGIITHNCRCTAIPVVRGKGSLSWETGEQWFRRQDAPMQRQILGPGRYSAWQAGRFDLEDTVTRREDATWGASLVPTPLRDLLAA